MKINQIEGLTDALAGKTVKGTNFDPTEIVRVNAAGTELETFGYAEADLQGFGTNIAANGAAIDAVEADVVTNTSAISTLNGYVAKDNAWVPANPTHSNKSGSGTVTMGTPSGRWQRARDVIHYACKIPFTVSTANITAVWVSVDVPSSYTADTSEFNIDLPIGAGAVVVSGTPSTLPNVILTSSGGQLTGVIAQTLAPGTYYVVLKGEYLIA